MSLTSIFEFVFAFLIGCFYAVMVVLSTLWGALRRPRNIFKWMKRDRIPACLQDSSLGNHCFVHLENIKIHYVAAGEEGKPLMLLVHGFPEFWYSWRHQIREFKKDYRVVAIDQRGYGDSDKPSSVSSYKIQNLVKDLKQLVPALGYKSCTLVGHDWGGAVCWTFAAEYPDVVDRLIVMNCPLPQAMLKYVRENSSQLKKSWYIFFFQVPYLPELSCRLDDFKMLDRMFTGKAGVKSDKMTKEDVEAYKYVFSQKDGFVGPINYYRASVRYPYPSKEYVLVPSLLIWGCQDVALEKGLAAASAPYVKNLTIKYVEEASHWVQMDQPEKVNEYMREFLKEQKQ